MEAAKTEEALADIGDGATRGSQKAKAPLEMTEKEIEDIKRKAREARLELARMDPDADVDDFIDSFGTNPSGNKINEAFKGDKAHLIASDKARVRGLLGDVEAGKELDKGLETGEIVVKSTGSGGNVVEGVGDIVEGTGDIVKGAEGAGDAAEGVGDIVEGMGDAAKVADDAGDAVEEFGDAVKKTGKEAAGKGAKGVGSLGKAFGGAVKSAWAFLAANPAIIAGVVGIAAIAGAAYAAWYFSAE